MYTLILAVSALLAYLVFYFVERKRASSCHAKHLPRPRGIPYVGIPHKLAPEAQWLQLHDWRKVHGPIYQAQVMGKPYIVITSRKVQQEFLLKNKAAFGDRPNTYGLPWIRKQMVYLPLITDAEKSRIARRAGGKLLASIPGDQLISTCLRAAKDLVHALHADPCSANVLVDTYISRITCELFWGDSSMSTATKNCLAAWKLMLMVSPGATITSKLPLLHDLWDVLPDFLKSWNAPEEERRAWERNFWEEHQAKSIANMKENGTWTMAGHMAQLEMCTGAEKYPGNDIAKSGIQGDSADLVGMLAIIGSLALAVPVQEYLIAMCHFPNWQEKAAAELDRVCPDRLPLPSDLPNLPVFRAVCREINRWRPASPIGAPREIHEDMEYRGYSVPAGATILSPIWSLERDPVLYPHAEEFRPERWLERGWPSYREPLTEFPKLRGDVGFGWGTRYCLGAEYAEVVNMLVIGALLKTTVVSKKTDHETGEEIDISTMNYEPFMIFTRRRPWQMIAKPRGEGAMSCLARI